MTTFRGHDYVPGTKEIQVLDTGFEVRYNLSNDDQAIPERQGDGDADTERDDMELVQEHTDEAEEVERGRFERWVQATWRGEIWLDDFVQVISLGGPGGGLSPRLRAQYVMAELPWDDIEQEMREWLSAFLNKRPHIPPNLAQALMENSQGLYIGSKILSEMIWCRFDDDGDEIGTRGAWVIRALEQFERGGGSLIEEGDPKPSNSWAGNWDMAFSKAMGYDATTPQVIRRIFALAAAMLWGE